MDAIISFNGVKSALSAHSEPRVAQMFQSGVNFAYTVCAAKLASGILFLGFGVVVWLLATLSETAQRLEKIGERIAWNVGTSQVKDENPFATKS
jgi:hypothetical protein